VQLLAAALPIIVEACWNASQKKGGKGLLTFITESPRVRYIGLFCAIISTFTLLPWVCAG